MKYIILILLTISFSSYGQHKKCHEFKTGEFVYPNLQSKISLRHETIQESYNNGKLEAVWKVKWLNECEYELICEKVLTDNVPFKIGDRMAVTILETDSNCYTFSLIVYNELYPKGFKIPNGKMCRKL